jgi:hypothetical protein
LVRWLCKLTLCIMRLSINSAISMRWIVPDVLVLPDIAEFGKAWK